MVGRSGGARVDEPGACSAFVASLALTFLAFALRASLVRYAGSPDQGSALARRGEGGEGDASWWVARVEPGSVSRALARPSWPRSL